MTGNSILQSPTTNRLTFKKKKCNCNCHKEEVDAKITQGTSPLTLTQDVESVMQQIADLLIVLETLKNQKMKQEKT